jgi:hypothetical protein
MASKKKRTPPRPKSGSRPPGKRPAQAGAAGPRPAAPAGTSKAPPAKAPRERTGPTRAERLAAAEALWSALISMTTVLYGVLFVRSIPLSRGWKSVGVPAWQPVVAYTLLGITILVFLWGQFTPEPFPQTNNLPVTRGMLLLGLVAAAPAVLGLWLVYARLRVIAEVLKGDLPLVRRADEVLADLLGCRQTLSTCLAVLSLLVTAALIDTGGLRRALLRHGLPDQRFPAELVLLYGAFFTLVTLLIYVPAYVTWRSRAHDFTDAVYPLPPDARPEEDWSTGRTRLIQLLGADAPVSKNLTAAFGILAPLATSVLSVVVPGLK